MDVESKQNTSLTAILRLSDCFSKCTFFIVLLEALDNAAYAQQLNKLNVEIC